MLPHLLAVMPQHGGRSGPHAAPGDDRRLHAQFVKDFQHRNMARPAPAAAQSSPILAQSGFLVDQRASQCLFGKSRLPVNFFRLFIDFQLGLPRRFAKGGNVQNPASNGQEVSIFSAVPA